MSVGDRIKARRVDMRVSVSELAGRLNRSRATVYRYENGDIESVPIEVVTEIAAALDTTPAYLMGWTDDPINYGHEPLVPDESPRKKKLLDTYLLLLDATLTSEELDTLGADLESYAEFKIANLKKG